MFLYQNSEELNNYHIISELQGSSNHALSLVYAIIEKEII